jgi:UDP-2,3-diacylglucosamine hydrolase
LSAHYFVSDAHLGAGGGAERLAGFLETLRGRADSLFVLGDLFEFWFEYREAMPKAGFAVLAQLVALHRAGTRIGYLKGNHDFWFADFLARELGTTAADELDVRLDGRRTFLAHGDAIDRGLIPRLFRRLMRSRLNGALYAQLHPDFGIRLARRVARTSRGLGVKPYLVADMARFAEAKLSAGFDLVVLGHSHEPELLHLAGGDYLNSGDWLHHFSYGVLRDGVVSLERWPG